MRRPDAEFAEWVVAQLRSGQNVCSALESAA
jgi:hypothetical protein